MKFSLTVSKNETKNKETCLSKNLKGIVTKVDDIFYVICNNINYNITKSSYSCIGKLIIYPIDYKLHKAKIIRLPNECIDNKFYVPFKQGLEVVGDIVLIDNVEYFNIKKVIHDK